MTRARSEGKTRREVLYGLHGVHLDAYCSIVDPDNIWPVRHYTLRRWVPIWGALAFWLYVALQQACYHNRARKGGDRSWCYRSRARLAKEASMGHGTVDRLLHDSPDRKTGGRFARTGLCHWITRTELRGMSESSGKSVQWPNRYDIALTPPLAPLDQRGLAQYLLENGVKPNSDVEAALGPLEELSGVRGLDGLLELMDTYARRFSPPPWWPNDEILLPPGEYFRTPTDVVRALRLQARSESTMEAVRDACSRLYRAFIDQPQPLIQTQYFRQEWVPLLGHSLALLIVILRSYCFWSADELRDTVTIYPGEIANTIGITRRHLARLLDTDWARLFLTLVESGKGKPMVVKVLLKEELVPADIPLYHQLLLGNAPARASANAESAEAEKGHSGRQKGEEKGHSGRQKGEGKGHSGHQKRGSKDILGEGKGHSGHHVNTLITVVSTDDGSVGLKEKKHPGEPSTATTILLEDFGIGPPAKSKILKLDPSPEVLLAWLLYVVTQENLLQGEYNVPGYAARHFLEGERAPHRFEIWASLTPGDWRALWRHWYYDSRHYQMGAAQAYASLQDEEGRVGEWESYAEMAGAWEADFAGVFHDGPFGDEVVTPTRVKDLIHEAFSPPGSFQIQEDRYRCSLTIVPADSRTATWASANERDIEYLLGLHGIFHVVRVQESVHEEDLSVAVEEGQAAQDRGGLTEQELLKWSAALGELQLQMTQATFDTWLRDSRLLSHDDGVWTIGVKTGYAKDWLEHRLATTIRRTIARLTRTEGVEVRFVVMGEPEE
jgi:hypothetical protein